ncbi:MAG: DNA repair protein RecO [Candidatus Protochlamydia sp.]|nr:DNA repair protein RecO [Candidatus Protochlamydia sp.]
MSSEFQTAEGILLKVIPFQDYDQILVYFTLQAGLIKVLFRGSRSKKRGLLGLCIPLTRAEVIYKEKRGEIYSGCDIALLDSYRSLRNNLDHLNAACELLQILYQTQWVGKPAPLLFALLISYLDKIPFSTHPQQFTASFRLKVLKHEGFASFPIVCSDCQSHLETKAYYSQGEFYCSLHKPQNFCLMQDPSLLYRLAECRSIRDLMGIEVSDRGVQAIERYFRDVYPIEPKN